MAKYQKIEYRIGKDGKITENVIDASGSSCTETTKDLESALGEVESQELKPEYYESEVLEDYEYEVLEDSSINTNNQSLNQE